MARHALAVAALFPLVAGACAGDRTAPPDPTLRVDAEPVVCGDTSSQQWYAEGGWADGVPAPWAEPTVRWTRERESGERVEIGWGTIVAATLDRGRVAVTRLDLTTGSELWSSRWDAGADSFDVGVSRDGQLVTVRATDIGNENTSDEEYESSWQLLDGDTGSVLSSGDGGVDVHATVAAGATVVVGGTVAVDLASGDELWTSPRLVVSGDVGVFGRGIGTSSVGGVDLRSGKRVWERQLAESMSAASTFVAGDIVFIWQDAGDESPSGELAALDAATGTALWTIPDVARPGNVTWSIDGTAAYVTFDGELETLVAYDTADGAERWRTEGVRFAGAPWTADGHTFLSVGLSDPDLPVVVDDTGQVAASDVDGVHYFTDGMAIGQMPDAPIVGRDLAAPFTPRWAVHPADGANLGGPVPDGFYTTSTNGVTIYTAAPCLHPGRSTTVSPIAMGSTPVRSSSAD